MSSWSLDTLRPLPAPLWTSLALLLLACLCCSRRITPLVWALASRAYGLHELILHSASLRLSAGLLPNNQLHQSATDPPSLPIKSLHPPHPTPGSAPRMYYPGLINSSSNLCFLNAVLQSLASMPHVIEYLNVIQSYGLPHTPVANALREMLVALNTPREHQAVLKPFSVAQALLGHASGPRSTLFNSEQQDAQEFLVTMIDALEAEAKLLAEHLLRNHRSLKLNPQPRHLFCQEARKIRRSPFRGLMAHRIACATCGFTSVIRHSSADHFSLNVPHKTSCRLESCLQEYTKLEVLDEYICRKCSLKKTHETLAKQLSQMQGQPTSKSKKKQMSGIKKKLEIIRSAIVEDPERELPGQLSIERVASLATTKQTMFARPPDSLTFHISRSTGYARGVSFKNHCQVTYPEELILDPYCTSFELTGDATQPISTRPPSTNEYRYRLSSVVVHFGSHSFGHYITYRKSPVLSSPNNTLLHPVLPWYRISDESVQLASVDDALGSNPFLLMYERVHIPLLPRLDLPREISSLRV